MTAQEVIQAAMRKLGVYASGETPTTTELADGLSALQSMLRAWAGRRLVVFASVKDTLTLVAGTASYTWGSGGTLATTRPHSVFGAYVLDNDNVSHPVEQITEDEYRRIQMKTTAGRPDHMFLHQLYPLSYIYLYPTPDTVETLLSFNAGALTPTPDRGLAGIVFAEDHFWITGFDPDDNYSHKTKFGPACPADITKCPEYNCSKLGI